MQSQTTFAQLAKDEEGKYQVRTLKQKIWVEGVSYELQEIYGMEQATAAAKDREVSCLITHQLAHTFWGAGPLVSKCRDIHARVNVAGVVGQIDQRVWSSWNETGPPWSQGVASAARTAEQAEERLCVICLVNERDTTVLPCRHMCMCHECAQELRKQTSKCPICRNHVESLLHIRMVRPCSTVLEVVS